jgi:hypothetical protein
MESNTPICDCLKFVLDYELSHGNPVVRLETRPNIGRTVVFANQLKIWGTTATGSIPRGVKYWDAKTPPEAGWRCTQHEYLIVGPTVY